MRIAWTSIAESESPFELVGYVPEAVRDPVDRIRSPGKLIRIVVLLHRWIMLYVAGATGVGMEVLR